jgi:pentapeptide MXKDX repeat protein
VTDVSLQPETPKKGNVMNRSNRMMSAVLLSGALVLAACGDDDETPAPATQPAVTEETMVDEAMTEDTMTEDTMTEDSMTEDSMMEDEVMTDTTAAP